MWRHPRTYMFAGLLLMVPLAGWLLRAQLTEQVDSYAACAEAGFPVTDTNPKSCSDGHRTFLGPAASPAPPEGAITSVPFEILVEGDSGGNYPKNQEVISTPAAWQKYWTAVHSGLKSLPPILPVDFSSSDVVALSEGRQVTGGYNLKITGITTSVSGTTIDVTESIPTTTCNVTESFSNRYFMARTTGKLVQPVNFRITTDYRHC